MERRSICGKRKRVSSERYIMKREIENEFKEWKRLRMELRREILREVDR